MKLLKYFSIKATKQLFIIINDFLIILKRVCFYCLIYKCKNVLLKLLAKYCIRIDSGYFMTFLVLSSKWVHLKSTVFHVCTCQWAIHIKVGIIKYYSTTGETWCSLQLGRQNMCMYHHLQPVKAVTYHIKNPISFSVIFVHIWPN